MFHQFLCGLSFGWDEDKHALYKILKISASLPRPERGVYLRVFEMELGSCIEICLLVLTGPLMSTYSSDITYHLKNGPLSICNALCTTGPS